MTTPDVTRDEVDEVAAALEAIRTEVRRRSGYRSPADVPPLGAGSPITEAADLARISAHLPVTWETPIIGRWLALAKRGMRLALRWYINPIVEQQNAFNDAVVRALSTLDARQQELLRRLEARDGGEPREP